MAYMTKLLVVDDHPCVRESISMLLPRKLGIEIVGGVGTLKEAVQLSAETHPDMVLLDMILPDGRPPETLDRLRQSERDMSIIVFTGSTDEQMILRALDRRPRGFINKLMDPLRIRDCIMTVAEGGTYYCKMASEIMERHHLVYPTLSTREMEVLRLVASGHSSKEIGAMLGLGTRTVESHRAAMMTKLQVNELASLIRIAIKMGLVDG